MFYTYRKVTKVTKTVGDKTTTEEVVESSEGPEAKAKAEEVGKEVDGQMKKVDNFFKKMDEAFKELW